MFKVKLQEDRKRAVNFDTDDLFKPKELPPRQLDMLQSPPRVVSDQLINIFFQEWAPMFPLLHRPSFLRTYQEYLVNPRLETPHAHAQMHLVFCIATLASSVRASPLLPRAIANAQQSDTKLVPMYEAQWHRALNAVLFEPSLETLQCLILAQIYCIIKGDFRRLVHYLGVGVTTSSLLSLHQSQHHSSATPLVREIQKRVFWSLYTIDWQVAQQHVEDLANPPQLCRHVFGTASAPQGQRPPG